MCVEILYLSPFPSAFLSFFLFLPLSVCQVCPSIYFSSIPSQLLSWTWFPFFLHYDSLLLSHPFFSLSSFVSPCLFFGFLLDSHFQMFEDEHCLEGAGCGSAESTSLLSIAVAMLSHQITLTIILSALPASLFPLCETRTSPDPSNVPTTMKHWGKCS